MCKAMNRSFISVILGGFGETAPSENKDNKTKMLSLVALQMLHL